MAKIVWEVFQEGYQLCSVQVVANTRSAAIGICEQQFTQDMKWEDELAGTVNPDTGSTFLRPPMPTYRAEKLRRA